MKTEKLNFQWFEKEDRRKPLQAFLGQDGKLRLRHQQFGWASTPRIVSWQLVMDTKKGLIDPKQGT